MKYLIGISLVAMLASPALGAYLTDAFSYSDGNLTTVGSPTWGGTPSTAMTVASQVVKFDALPAGTAWASAHAVTTGDVVRVEFDVLAGTSNPGNFWNIYIQEPGADAELARWYGGGFNVASRRATVVSNALTPATWHHFGVDLTFSTGTAEYFFDGVYNHTQNFGAGLYSGVGPIRMTVGSRGEAGDIYFDNLNVTPEPATLGLLLLGLPFLRRRR